MNPEAKRHATPDLYSCDIVKVLAQDIAQHMRVTVGFTYFYKCAYACVYARAHTFRVLD